MHRVVKALPACILSAGSLILDFASHHKIPVHDLFGLVIDRPELFSKDGVHFNAAGQRVLGERVAQLILDQGQPLG